MYIALSDKLLKEFLSYNGTGHYNKDLLAKLFKYLQPFKLGRYQSGLLSEPILKSLTGNNSLISLSEAQNETDLIKDTKFKLMLTDNLNTYPYINILGDEVNINYNATYKTTENRSKAIKHIKELLLNSNEIEIIDSYLFPQFGSTQWDENFQIIKEIVPRKSIKLKLVSFNVKQEHKSALRGYCNNWNISYPKLNKNEIHDRYIKTDSIEILISSGVNYLKDISKDLTYIVKEK